MLMKDTKVTVTIGIATYNGESFIKRAIDSIINQSLSNFEILISDDVLQFLFSAVLIPVTTYQITRHNNQKLSPCEPKGLCSVPFLMLQFPAALPI